MTNQFVSFMVVGGIAAAVNIASRILFSLAVSYEVAIVLAFFCGLVTGFLLNRAFVFRSAIGGNTSRQAVRFTLVNLLALVQVWVIGVGLARFLFPRIGFSWHPELTAHAIAVASPIVTSYFAHKYFSFAPQNIGSE